MTRNEKAFLKKLEKTQRTLKADLRRLESFNSAFPGKLRADKVRRERLRHIYASMTLREVIKLYHQEIVAPREDRYVHVSVVKRLREEIERLKVAQMAEALL